MEAASAIGGLISLGIEVTTILHWYISTVKNAPRVALELCEELESMNQVLKLFKKKSSSPDGQTRFPETSVLFASTNSCRERLHRLRKDLQPLSETSGIRRVFHRLKWPLDEAGVKEDIAALHRLSQVYLFSLTIEGFSLLSDRLEAAVSQMTTRLQELETDQTLQGAAAKAELAVIVESLRVLFNLPTIVVEIDHKIDKQQLIRELNGLRSWIPAFDSSSRQKDLQWRRSKGTGQWLLKRDEFQKWIEGSSPENTLFCHGSPGSGKTFLASMVVDYLQQQSAQSDTVRVAYFYFDYVHRQEQGPDSVLGSLLKQLLSGYDAIPQSANALQQRFKKGLDPPDWSSLVAEFKRICSDVPATFIVLDALDECDSNVGLSRILDLVGQLQGSGVRLFVTSRPYSHTINQAFGSSGKVLIKASDEDITLFLKDRIAARRDDSIDEMLQDDILKAILGKSQGM